jgi:HNH endonuclease
VARAASVPRVRSSSAERGEPPLQVLALQVTSLGFRQQSGAVLSGQGEVHHVKHKKNGGKTSVKDCVLLCFFHHQIVIYRWGWTLVLNPDGTTSAWNPDKTKVLHSHSPPARPG